MQEQQINAYAPHIDRKAISELYGREPEYYRQDDLRLKLTEDDGPWRPSEDIKDLVPNIELIEVELIDRETDLVQLTDKFLTERTIGLVLMGRNINRHTRPAMIVLISRDRYYAIDPNDTEIGIKFLKVCVQNRNITIWTTNGLHEADCLYHNYKIALFNSNAMCCTGQHLQLMKVLALLPDGDPVAHLYPHTAFAKRSGEIRLESFEKLVQIWLSFHDTRDITFNLDQLIHLSRKPLDQTAINIIKKRCSLVLLLIDALDFFSNLELTIMSGNVLSALLKYEDSTRAYLLKAMKKNEKNSEASIVYFSYLDGNITSLI